MKRTLILLLLLLLVVGVYYVIGEKPEEETTINVEDRNFITKDRDAVGTITIKTKGRPLTHLSRKKNEAWYLNNKYKANQRIAANMLGALSAMTIQYIPNKLENQTAIDRMDMHGIEIKTYDYNGNVLTDFILGTNINTEYGTYFKRANAKQCYVMSIPASPGGLRNYFTQTKEDLRDMTVFAYETDDIKKVSMNYFKDLKNSFEITRNGSDYVLSSPVGQSIKDGNQNIMKAYIAEFYDLQSEFVKNDHTLRDSITEMLPFAELKIETKDNPAFSCKLYPVNDIVNSNINTRSVDDLTKMHERQFCFTSNEDFYMVQDKNLRRFLRKVDYFYDN